MDLFDYAYNNAKEDDAPLAKRMRPNSLEEFIGQDHIIGDRKLLSRSIRSDTLTSLILYGPPGTGKTTLAEIIANTTNGNFISLNATCATKADLEKILEEAGQLRSKKTIIFIDEIHRFNKAQQDYLLSFVENGTIILIGATTENPFFEVNNSLISRSMMFELKALPKEEIKKLLIRATNDKLRGPGNNNCDIYPDALDFIAEAANGDARKALNALELAVLTAQPNENKKITITIEVASECIQKRIIQYDKSGDHHYDTISAFIKSMRGSDPDASIYYLARMLYAGESLEFITRRIMICASEDIGNADPKALTIATNAAIAVERVGMPDAQVILAQAVLYMATAPKSDSAIIAINSAMDFVKNNKPYSLPPHMQDDNYKGAAKLGRGIGYINPHSFPGHYVKQQYMPTEIIDKRFYYPNNNEH